MELHTIGIDLGKTVFHLVGLNRHGEVVVRKKRRCEWYYWPISNREAAEENPMREPPQSESKS